MGNNCVLEIGQKQVNQTSIDDKPNSGVLWMLLEWGLVIGPAAS